MKDGSGLCQVFFVSGGLREGLLGVCWAEAGTYVSGDGGC